MQLLGQPEWTGLEEDLTELMQMCESNGSAETAYYSALLQHYTRVNSEVCSKPLQHTKFGHSLHPCRVYQVTYQYVLTEILRRLMWSQR